VSPPAHGHNPLEIMTQQDYLVPGDTTEIARFTEDGFYYKGEFIDDAGEVHRLLKEVLGMMKAEQSQ
jgi:hypothetical protein